MRRVSIVGLGKLGAPIAAAIASRGHDVVGVDTDPRAVEALAAGRAPVGEPGLQTLIDAHRDRLYATSRVADAVRATDVTFVVVPTPSEASGGFSVEQVARAFEEIGCGLSQKDGWHTVVLTSTVLPGATRDLVEILDRHAGGAGQRFGVCYNPAFVALGTVVRDFLNPDFLLIGELDRRSGDHLAGCYRDILGAAVPIKRMSIENAELAKLAVNAFVTMKITFANLMVDLCAATPGGDVEVVTDAMGADTRIGRKYLSGGLGFGGPCFPRDNKALAAVARASGVPADLPLLVDRSNSAVPERIMASLGPRLRPGATAAVLGLAYKPGSPVIEASQAVAIANGLAARGWRVRAYDPLAAENARGALGPGASVAPTLAECLRGAELVVVATPDPEFARLTAVDFAQPDRRVVVVDLWRILSGPLAGAPAIDYIAYGRGAQPADERTC